MSKRNDRTLDALPGFEDTITPCRPGDADLSDEKRYTGEVLFRDHPNVFKAVAASFFIDGLSVRATAARYRVSVNTVRAIRDMALESASTEAGRAALFIKSKADRLRGIVHTRALEVIYDRLSDPKTAAEIPVDTLMSIAKMSVEDDNGKKTSIVPASAEVIDIDEFDDVMNGLDREKKSARTDGEELAGNDGVNTGSECSTGNSSDAVCSLALSNATLKNGIENDSLCNSLSNGAENVSPVSPASTDSPADVLKDPCHGGGGDPGVGRAGGVNYNGLQLHRDLSANQ